MVVESLTNGDDSKQAEEKSEPNAQTDAEQDEATAAANEAEQREREELNTFIVELQAKINSKAQLRAENVNCEHPGDSFFAKLDSSLKRNTAFVKKLKQFTAAQLDTLLKDMSGLNLSKYISEICAALSEAKMKMTDVPAAVTLCSRLHQTYADFDAQFLEAWQKSLALKPGEKISNPSKLRVDLRLFAELVSSGVISSKQGLQLLGSVLINVISQDKEDHSNFSIILSFCRHCGEEYAGLVPRKMQNLAEKYGGAAIPKSDFLAPDRQQNLRGLLKDYFKNLCKHLISEQQELLNMTKTIRRTMESKGEISNDKKEKCELMQANFDKLLSSAQTLSDLLDEPLPELTTETESCNAGTVIENMLEDATMGELDPWGDDETKSFYTDLPDLRQYLPNFSAPKVDLEENEEPTEMTEEALDADIDVEMEIDDPPSTTSDPPNDKDAEAAAEPANEESAPTAPLPDKIANALMEAGRLNAIQVPHSKQHFDQFLTNLNNCVNKELIDSAAIEFLLNFNTKNNRKKLTKSIFTVQRTRLDLLPFLSRFVAIVNLCNTDVAVDLSEMLRKEFKWHIRKKNQLNIESKIKIVRFLGEMVKFGLCKKFDALSCLKMLLRDFQHHQIEMACAFIEVAGIYLYNCRDSRLLTNVFLDQMMRLKTATALDSRHAAQVESVYYLVKPPDTVKQDAVVRPVIHEYIRHLIFEELCKQNVDRCIKMMRRINWDDPEVSNYAIKCMSKAYLLRFPLIRCLADLVSGLSSYQERAVTMVIDNVFEDIRAGLEIHSPKLAQRRIAMAKYLGELYNYKLVESTNILNTLYSIISLGVSTEEGVYSELDPPDSLFRLKLACMLLDTCGQYFTSSMSRKKLDYFLVFFQHYYWYKKSHPVFSRVENTADLFPILVDHMYRDCVANVRPKLKLYKNLDQAKEAIEKLKEELYPQLKAGMQAQTETDTNLEPIREDSEFDDALSDDSSSEREPRTRNHDACGDDDPNTEDANNANELANTTDWTENEYMLEDCEPPVAERSKEDLEFEQMFEKMAADSYQERIKETVKPNTKDIPVPMMARTSKKSYEQITTASGNQSGGEKEAAKSNASNAAGNTAGSGGSVVPFVLMVRSGKGGKQQFKQFVAPSDSQLAINLKLQEEKTREEKERVKRLTLNITERIEEEDYQESLMQSQRNMSQNHYQRPSKPKFRHQKGAPDADLIFN
ncbi:regulator of nonsense transcripts 2 [Bactrocera tryoni]|uniref:regulator of nonsense transcripts 2 n=1 Tax=Bactrocera tryoni TaxID=59916 RepID=UPI001A97EB24|nr:regulator of nonsense transcripts 2 [Bactrocera tryoni]